MPGAEDLGGVASVPVPQDGAHVPGVELHNVEVEAAHVQEQPPFLVEQRRIVRELLQPDAATADRGVAVEKRHVAVVQGVCSVAPAGWILAVGVSHAAHVFEWPKM